MFCGCHSLVGLNIPRLFIIDTENANFIFEDCPSLIYIGIQKMYFQVDSVDLINEDSYTRLGIMGVL